MKLRKPRRNKFNLSHERKFTCDMGILTPILCQDIVPGDKWKLRTELLLKMQALRAPMMHRVNCYCHFFFVPYRLIWKDFEEFYTGGTDGTSAPVYPTIAYSSSLFNGSSEDNKRAMDMVTSGSLMDYLGFPVLPYPETDVDPAFNSGIGPDDPISALPFRAYQLIWNEYYRDQNLQDPVEVDLSSGAKTITDSLEFASLFGLRYRAWEKDYFTSALPFAQRGPDVTLPIDSKITIGEGVIGTGTVSGSGAILRGEGLDTSNGQKSIQAEVTAQNPQDLGQGVVEGTDSNKQNGIVTAISGNLTTSEGAVNVKGNGTELESQITGPTINELRRSIRVQEWFEKNARGGARLIEQILSHFGVRGSDSRLQRPEYLGGGVQPIVVSELLQTSESTKQSPQGTQTGNGVSLGSTNQFKRFFEEPGILMGIMSIIPKPAYQQGIPRQWLHRDKFDFYWPEFAHLGEQEIKNEELYHDYTGQFDNDGVFGYAPRYSEYKYIPSSVHGDFRDSLDFWHLGRIFNTAPGLNGDFISVMPKDADRIFPIETEGSGNVHNPGRMYCQLYHHITAKRPMPKFGTPIL